MISELAWDDSVRVLKSCETVAVCCHISPDGDALGSMLGLGQYLRREGKKVWMSWGSAEAKVPPQYSFLAGADLVVNSAEVPEGLDVFVAIDCGDKERLELLKPKADSARTLMNVDHHISNPSFGDINLVDTGRASSAEIAYELVKRMGGTPLAGEATCLYTGIVTDTGRFQYSDTSAQTLRFAAELRDAGADHELIADSVYESASFSYLRVLGIVLSRATLQDGLVWSWLAHADLGDLPLDETEHFVEMLRGVKEAKVAALLKQHGKDEWKVSMRSKGLVDVAKIAQSFGGGGHERAAGATLAGSREDVSGKVKQALLTAVAGNGVAASVSGAAAPSNAQSNSAVSAQPLSSPEPAKKNQ